MLPKPGPRRALPNLSCSASDSAIEMLCEVSKIPGCSRVRATAVGESESGSAGYSTRLRPWCAAEKQHYGLLSVAKLARPFNPAP